MKRTPKGERVPLRAAAERRRDDSILLHCSNVEMGDMGDMGEMRFNCNAGERSEQEKRKVAG